MPKDSDRSQIIPPSGREAERELEQGLAWRGHRRSRRVRGHVPAPSQLANRQQPPHLCRTKPVPPSRCAEIDGRPFDDASLCEQGSQARQVAPLADQCGEQPGFIRRGHVGILTHISMYVDA